MATIRPQLCDAREGVELRNAHFTSLHLYSSPNSRLGQLPLHQYTRELGLAFIHTVGIYSVLRSEHLMALSLWPG